MVDSPCSSRSLATFTSLPLPAAPSAPADCAEPARLALARLRSAPLDSPSSRCRPPCCPCRRAALPGITSLLPLSPGCFTWHHAAAAHSDVDAAFSPAAPPSLSLLTALQRYNAKCLQVMPSSSQKWLRRKN